MCPEAVSLFEGSSFKAGALSLLSHYLLSQLHSTRQKCDIWAGPKREHCVYRQGGKTFFTRNLPFYRKSKSYICINIGQKAVQKFIIFTSPTQRYLKKPCFICRLKSHLSQSIEPYISRFPFIKFGSLLTFSFYLLVIYFFFLAKYVYSSQVNGFRSNFEYLTPFLVNIQHKETRYLLLQLWFGNVFQQTRLPLKGKYARKFYFSHVWTAWFPGPFLSSAVCSHL